MRARWLLVPLTAIALTASATAAGAAPGGLDPNFGHGGIAITNGFGTPGDAAMQSNSDILVVVDSTFPTSEFHYVAGQIARDAANAIAVEPNGDVVVGGVHWLGSAVFGVARLTPGGTLDSTFGSGGTLTTTIQGDDAVSTLLPEPNDEIVAVDFTEDNSAGVSGVALARYFG